MISRGIDVKICQNSLNIRSEIWQRPLIVKLLCLDCFINIKMLLNTLIIFSEDIIDFPYLAELVKIFSSSSHTSDKNAFPVCESTFFLVLPFFGCE